MFHPPESTIRGSNISFVCQRDDCPSAGSAEAAKVCYSHFISIKFSPDSPPPLYLCIECANEIHRENPNEVFHDILHPMHNILPACENKVSSNPKAYFDHPEGN
ncbi:hypothetical protein QAD02_007637 [Eretmocerus hayati]|uniref:Uncharacterized protein n=1 Tax=Eretmocerus hayati TaxID=131215 RepID=A0ACC2N476_9HYME|nr:hypothetical protein QAD02_007637 [Eretmocerus hayati]